MMRILREGKSGKREMACLCLLFIAGLIIALFNMDNVPKIQALSGIVTGIGATVVIMALGVFGLHYIKPPQ